MKALHQGIGMTSRRTRERMVARLQELGIRNQAVLQAMLETPRHIFVDEALAHRAYDDTALPIGLNQTISQPYVVARMTELLLERSRGDKVLEIGTGSGYQTAILARLARQVYSVERILALQNKARKRLAELKLFNVHYRHGDGCEGWADHAPYDGILVAAAPETVPFPLTEQLAKGGAMVIPVGGALQTLRRIVRREQGLEQEDLETVVFVPLLPGRE